eukprot:14477942-Alexandrium_andersonii.AAC.1
MLPPCPWPMLPPCRGPVGHPLHNHRGSTARCPCVAPCPVDQISCVHHIAVCAGVQVRGVGSDRVHGESWDHGRVLVE